MPNLIRAALPPNIVGELKHLALDMGKPVQELLVGGAILLLRYHDWGERDSRSHSASSCRIEAAEQGRCAMTAIDTPKYEQFYELIFHHSDSTRLVRPVAIRGS